MIVRALEQECLRVGAVLAKREPDPDAARERFFLLPDAVDVALLLAHFRVLSHILRRRKIVIVARVNLGVKCWHEGSLNGAQVIPMHALEEGVIRNLRERGVPHTSMGDEAGRVYQHYPGTMKYCRDGPRNGVPGDIGEVEDEIFRLIVLRSPENLCPVLEICPCFFGRAPTEGREAGQELEQDAAERPIIHGIRIRLSP